MKISIKALWFQPEIGMCGYVGAVLSDGTPVALCSKEKWDLGRNDSLRKSWTGNVRVGPKVLHTNYTEEQLRHDGLLSGRLAMTVPPELRHLVR